MRAAVVLAAAAVSALNAPAFHIQVGFSARHSVVENGIGKPGYERYKHPYVCTTEEVGATPGYLDKYYYQNTGYAPCAIGTSFGVRQTDGSVLADLVGVRWDDADDPESVMLFGFIGEVPVTVGEAVHVGTVDKRISEVVITVRGDPCSTVFNATGQSLTINGVTIGAGQSERLKFPVRLKMDEIDGVRFYDLDSAEELSATYSGGAYLIGWTGNIRVSDRPDPDTSVAGAPDERLVYGDMSAANSDSLLFATNGSPIYSKGKTFGTNVALNVWWDFDQDEWGQPAAYINDSVVCPSHATGHIVPYVVSDINPNSSPETRVVYFTASLIPSGSKTGGACAIKCYGKDEGDYAQVPSNHKAEVEAGLNTARFKLTIGPYGLWWKVEAATD